MNKIFAATIFPLIVLLALPATSFSQSSFGDSVDVRVVNVEAWVVDDEGLPVTGLTIDDFEILEDGVPVDASFFQEMRPDGSAPAAPAASAEAVAASPPQAAASTPAPDPGYLMVYVDELHLGVLTRKQLIADMRAFLKQESFPPDRIMIVRQNRGLTGEAFFGSSAEDIEAALDRMLDGGGVGELRADQERRLTVKLIQQYWAESQVREQITTTGGPRAAVGGAGTDFSGVSAGIDACVWFTQRAVVEVELYAERTRDRTVATISNLTEAATFLSGIEGVKTLLYLGDSLERSPGSDLMTYVEGFCRTGDPQSRVFPVTEQVATAFATLTRHANANRVTIYAFQSEGLTTGTGMDPSQSTVEINQSARVLETARRQAARDGLGYLAESTGGEAFLQKNKFGGSLASVAQSMNYYYSLGYAPPHGGDGDEHEIEVRLRKGVEGKIRHRRGYVDKDPMQRVTESLHTAMVLGIGENPYEVRLGAGAIEEKGENFHVPLRVLVPAEKLVFLPQGKGEFAMLNVQVLARGDDGKRPELFTKSFRIPSPEEETGELFSLPIDLELSAGVQTVAVSLHDGASRETSYVSTSLQLGGAP